MPIEARIRELDARHTRLNNQIDDDFQHHPSIDTLDLAQLKKKKLHLKEQIASLRRQV